MALTFFGPVRDVPGRPLANPAKAASTFASANRQQPSKPITATDLPRPTPHRLSRNIIAHEHATAVPGISARVRIQIHPSISNRETLRRLDHSGEAGKGLPSF